VAFITSANSTYTIVIPNLFPQPQTLRGYATDSSFETEASDIAEVMKGVDGVMSYGFVPFTVTQTINFQADSQSAFIFETWLQTMKAAQEVYPASAIIVLPALKRKYIQTEGVLKRAVQIPGSRKVLQARAFVIEWNDISPVPL
jgi:hypothetical protein